MEIGSIEFVGTMVGTLILILITTTIKNYFTGQKSLRDNVVLMMKNMEDHAELVKIHSANDEILQRDMINGIKSLSDGIDRALKVVKWFVEDSGRKFPKDLF